MPLLVKAGEAIAAIRGADTGPQTFAPRVDHELVVKGLGDLDWDWGPEIARYVGTRVDPDLPAKLDAALVLDQLDRDLEARMSGEDHPQLEPELCGIDAGEDPYGW